MKILKFRWLLLCQSAFLALACGVPSAIAGQNLNLSPFVTGSLKQIEDSRQGKPFLLVFWSPDCASCRKELDMLSQLRESQPGIDIVMIATDEEADPDRLGRFLQEHRIDGAETWYFSESNAPKLRYEVDSSWYGEIPRTYFYTADHQRFATSGLLKSEQVDAWLSTIASD